MAQYLLHGPDNDSYMYQGEAQPPRCGECGAIQDRRWTDPTFVLKDRSADASYTYDGCLIVSERFRVAMGEQPGVEFLELPDSGWYRMVVEGTVLFDAERRRTRFENRCPVCRRFNDVAGATPVFLSERLEAGVAATNIEFGSGDEQHPLVILASDVAARLRAARLAGVDLTLIEDQ